MPVRPGVTRRIRITLILLGKLGVCSVGLVLSILSMLGSGWALWRFWHRLPDAGVPWNEIGLLVESGIAALTAQMLSGLINEWNKRVKPPLNAEFVFYLFMTPQNCDALVGDLEERYRLVHRKFGRWRANLWYWFQTFISLRPIIWAAVKRVSGLMAVIEVLKRRGG